MEKMKELTADGKFRSTYHRTRINILYTAIWLNQYVRDFIHQFDLTPQQYNILKIVANSEKPMNVLQIRDRMFEKLSDSSRLINRLELKGLLSKKKCREDKRLVEITITTAGLAVIEKVSEHIFQLDEPLKGLGEEDAEKISELLLQMRKTSSKKSEY